MSIDLYAIYNLDKQQQSEALAQQLTERLSATDPSDSLTRGRIETAQAILGDPSRRAVYDAQLGDPSAPPVTEQVLAALAGRPVPAAPPITLTSLLASTQGKLIAGGAAALALILLLVIAVAAVRGGDDDGGEAVTASSSGEESNGDLGNCWVTTNDKVGSASWSGDKRPSYSVLLNQEIDLPPEFAALADPEWQAGWEASKFGDDGLTQYQDKTVGVLLNTGRTSLNAVGATMYVTTVSPEGTVESATAYSEEQSGEVPTPFDLAKDSSYGYYRVHAEDGVTVPAEAGGDKEDKQFVTAIMPDAFDDDVVWVLVRGASKLYKATVAFAVGSDEPVTVENCPKS